MYNFEGIKYIRKPVINIFIFQLFSSDKPKNTWKPLDI